MEQIISSRLSGICAGNENFHPLDTQEVVNQMINLLREQLYQQQIMISHDSLLDDDEEYESVSNRSSVSMASVASAGQNWPNLTQQISEMKEQLTRSRSSLCQEMEETLSELKTTILNEVKQELHGSSKHLQEELKSKDQEIQRLRLELLKNSIDQGKTRKRETFESDV
ncbi:hypothetical protein CHS0354_037013 [Potamilus streckersoni]|uniref:Uncharacterized protein n=1 Tax=Potamilus streckersoni TaxID=2493646 RepID=A0AAE0VXA4_9BIVA|nr:hypothetical protein CHS0354_037013 [Potamilus streckersoni]